MSESKGPFLNHDTEPEEEPLGLKELLLSAQPIGIIQRFIVPLGTNALTVLDPLLFGVDEGVQEPLGQLFQGFPFVRESEGSGVQRAKGVVQRQVIDVKRSPPSPQRDASDSMRVFKEPPNALHSPSNPPEWGVGGHSKSPILGDLGGQRKMSSTSQTPSQITSNATVKDTSEALLAAGFGSAPLARLDENSILNEVEGNNVPWGLSDLEEPSPVVSEENQIRSSSIVEDLGSDAIDSIGDPVEILQRSSANESSVEQSADKVVDPVSASASEPLAIYQDATSAQFLAPDLTSSADLDPSIQRTKASSSSRVEPISLEGNSQIPDRESQVGRSQDLPLASASINPLEVDTGTDAQDTALSPLEVQAAVKPEGMIAPDHSLSSISSDTSDARPAPNLDLPSNAIEAPNLAPPQGDNSTRPSALAIQRQVDAPNPFLSALSQFPTDDESPLRLPSITEPQDTGVVPEPTVSELMTETSFSTEATQLSRIQNILESSDNLDIERASPNESASTSLNDPLAEASNVEAIVLQSLASAEAITPQTELQNFESETVFRQSSEVEQGSATPIQRQSLPEDSQRDDPLPVQSERRPEPMVPLDLIAQTEAIASPEVIQSAPEYPMSPPSGQSASSEPQEIAAGEDAITQSKLEPTSLLSDLIDVPSIQSDASIQSESRLIASPETPLSPLGKPMSSVSKTPEAKGKENQGTVKKSPEGLFFKSIQFLSRAITSIANPTQVKTSPQSKGKIAAKDSETIQLPTQLASQNEVSVQLETETPIQQVQQTEARLPEIGTSSQLTTQPLESEISLQRTVEEQFSEAEIAETQFFESETSIQPLIQIDRLLPETDPPTALTTQPLEVETPIQRSVRDEVRSPDARINPQNQPSELAERLVKSEIETPVRKSVQDEVRLLDLDVETSIQSSELAEQSVQAKPETFVRKLVQDEVQSSEVEIQAQIKNEVETESPVQRSVQVEMRLLDPNIAAPIQSLEFTEILTQTETETPIQRLGQADVRSPDIEPFPQIELQSLETEALVQRMLQEEVRLPEIEAPTQFISQSEMQTTEVLSEQSIQARSRLSEIELQNQFVTQLENQSSEPENPIQESAQSEWTEPSAQLGINIPVQSSVQTNVQSPEIENFNQNFIRPEPTPVSKELVQAEIETPLQQSIEAESQAPESIEQSILDATETSMQRAIRFEMRSPDVETPTQVISQSEIQTSESIEESIQAEKGGSVRGSIEADLRLPATEPLTQAEAQAIELTEQSVWLENETSVQKTPEADERSRDLELPIQSSEWAEQSFQAESIQVDTRSPELETRTQSNARSIELAGQSAQADINIPIQRSVQVESLPLEIESPVQFESPSLETEASIQRSVESDPLPSEINSSLQFTDRPEIESLENKSSIQRSEQANPQLETRASKTEPPIQRAIQAELSTSEIETSIQSANFTEPQSLESIHQSVRGEIRSPEILLSDRSEAQSELQFPNTETPLQKLVQSEIQLPEAEVADQTFAWHETEAPILRSVQFDLRSPEVAPQIQPETQSTQLTEPSSQANEDVPSQKSVQFDSQFSETEASVQRSVQSDPQVLKREPQNLVSEQSEPQSSALIEPLIQSEIEPLLQRAEQTEARSPEIEPQLPFISQFSDTKTPVQQSAQVDERVPEVEISSQQFSQPEVTRQIESLHLPPSSSTLGVSDLQSPPEFGGLEGDRNIFATDHNTAQTEMRSPQAETQTQAEPEILIQQSVQVDPQLSSLDSQTQDSQQYGEETPISDNLSSETSIQLKPDDISDSETIQNSQDFPQLPQVLRNLSVLHPLIQANPQIVPEQPYPPLNLSPFPPAIQKRQNQIQQKSKDLENPVRELPTPQTTTPNTQSLTVTVSKPVQYAKLSIPPPKSKAIQTQSSHSNQSNLATPVTTLQAKRENQPVVIQRVRDQFLIPEGKEEIELERSTSDMSQDIETLAQIIYDQIQQRLRIAQERQGLGIGRSPW